MKEEILVNLMFNAEFIWKCKKRETERGVLSFKTNIQSKTRIDKKSDKFKKKE